MSCLWSPYSALGVHADGQAAAEKLLVAIKSNNEAHAQELIQHCKALGLHGSASPLYCQDIDGWTPLIWAASKGASRLVQMCLEAKLADVNHASLAQKLTSALGSTALHECAARVGEERASPDIRHYFETAKLLLKAGADPFLENSRGMTALDNAVKLGNVTMKNLLESKALFRGSLRMLSPAKLFGGQKWGLRHCVILPRRAYPNEPGSGMPRGRRTNGPDCPPLSLNPFILKDSRAKERLPLWLVCYKREDSYQPICRVPLAGASVAMLSEQDAPFSSEKAVLRLDKAVAGPLPGLVVSSGTASQGPQVQIQAPYDSQQQKGCDVLLNFSDIVNGSRGVLRRRRATSPEPPFFTGNIVNMRASTRAKGRSMSQVQPPQPAGSEKLRQLETQQRQASLGGLRDSAARRARPCDSGKEVGPRPPGVSQHSSSHDSEIWPSEAADDHGGRRHEHRHGHSHGRRALAWSNATPEQRVARAERWLSDAAERAPRALTARNPQFLVDLQDRKERERSGPGSGKPPPGVSRPSLQSQCEASEEHLSAGRASERPETARQVLQEHSSRPQALASAKTRSENLPQAALESMSGRGSHCGENSPESAAALDQSRGSSSSTRPASNQRTYRGGGSPAESAISLGTQSTKLIQAVVPSQVKATGRHTGGWEVGPGPGAKAELRSLLSTRQRILEDRRAEAKRRVQAYLTSSQAHFEAAPSAANTIQDTIANTFLDSRDSVLSIHSSWWRRDLVKQAVPLQRAFMGQAARDAGAAHSALFQDALDSLPGGRDVSPMGKPLPSSPQALHHQQLLLHSSLFQDARSSLPLHDVTTKQFTSRHLGLPYLSTLLRCPLTQEMYHEPVYASDGWTYEKNAILEHLKQHNTSPVTNEPITDQRLCPNLAVYKAVQAYLELNGRA